MTAALTALALDLLLAAGLVGLAIDDSWPLIAAVALVLGVRVVTVRGLSQGR